MSPELLLQTTVLISLAASAIQQGNLRTRPLTIFFAPQVFRDFAQQLDGIRRGKAEHAQFYDYGHMIEFSLRVRDRKIQASFRIREYQAGAEQTLLSAGFPVDYDLFVNAVHERTMQFLAELETAEQA